MTYAPNEVIATSWATCSTMRARNSCRQCRQTSRASPINISWSRTISSWKSSWTRCNNSSLSRTSAASSSSIPPCPSPSLLPLSTRSTTTKNHHDYIKQLFLVHILIRFLLFFVFCVLRLRLSSSPSFFASRYRKQISNLDILKRVWV